MAVASMFHPSLRGNGLSECFSLAHFWGLTLVGAEAAQRTEISTKRELHPVVCAINSTVGRWPLVSTLFTVMAIK